MLYQLRAIAQKEINTLSTKKIKFNHDPLFESSKIDFVGTILNEHDREQIIDLIKKIPLDKWSATINGDEIV